MQTTRTTPLPFRSLYRHGYARVSVCVPSLKVADPIYNLEQTLTLARAAHADHSAVALFPELGITGYSNDDLFHQDALLDAALAAVAQLVLASEKLLPVLVVGCPLRIDAKLFNCALFIHRGKILGITPKTYLPNYREFYEKRQFVSAHASIRNTISLLDQSNIPFGSDLLLESTDIPGLSIHAEICEDVWTPIPPSTFGALAGATILLNLSASNITVGKAQYRRDLCAAQSGRCVAAYLYTAAGFGESTTDMAWDGHALVYENANPLAESERFSSQPQRITADIDLDRLRQERMRLTSFNDSARDYSDRLSAFRRVPFTLNPPAVEIPLRRRVDRFPYVPHDPQRWDERCSEVYNIQVTGLEKRLAATNLKHLVIGVSGGLDSTHALIVCCRTMDRLGLPRQNILAYTLPGFATGASTKSNAWKLMNSLHVSATEIDIRPSCTQMLKDLNHPFSEGHPVHDITFENVQAGERTSHLFRLANQHNGLVVGTGDLSELALGWCTYGVGDQMSHYNVNSSVPKTLIQHLIRWESQRGNLSAEASQVLLDILNTEISPELVPTADGQPVQSTQATVGPYDLQDFHLYYITRYGFLPSKVAFLCHHAWADSSKGLWPPGYPDSARATYTLPEIKSWLRVFLKRFFQTSQFKRSAMPNGPKVGSGGSLSPRSDWRAPSDSQATAWLEELERNIPD